MTINPDLKDVLGQIEWAVGLAKRCKPYTPTEAEAKAAWAKLRGLEHLRWGCKVHIVFKEDAEWASEESGMEVPYDTGLLIALPGSRCSEPCEDGVVWVPHTRAEKCEGEPIWMQLQVLLANPEVAWVEVIK